MAPRSRRVRAIAAALALAVLAVGLRVLDRAYPPDLGRALDTSITVADRAGQPLRVFRSKDGMWRLPVDLAVLPPFYLALLERVEDQRFRLHPGIDPLAGARAVAQALHHGRIVSGASTITMQLARLLEPQPRTWSAKATQILRAAQLEWRFTKDEILALYLTLVPMGSNLEGVRAGSLAWFGKEPRQLTPAEAALLVALPQAPERLRPDRNPAAVQAARARILARGQAAGLLPAAELASAVAAPLPSRRLGMQRLAPHLSEQLAATMPPGAVAVTFLDADLQRRVEALLRDAIGQFPPPVDAAALIADHRTGQISAYAGSSAYFDRRRPGMADLGQAVRSPGSTLKPFVYGLAFEGLLAHPATLVADRPTRFADYAPDNFDRGFSGEVTLREALQRSLNLPAVKLLERVGPVRFSARFAESGLALRQEAGAVGGLPIVLGGVGTTLLDLATAYAALARGGELMVLHATPPTFAANLSATTQRILSPAAAAAVVRILAGIPPPPGHGAATGRLAYKTGTSHRFKDGWAFGFDGRHVLGIWLGRADGGPCTPCSGRTAAGLLFQLAGLLPAAPLPVPAPGASQPGPAPPSIARLDAPRHGSPATTRPRITFPVDASALRLGPGPSRVPLRAEGGVRPYRWLIDGHPLAADGWRGAATWRPEGPGFAAIEVVDAQGRSDRVALRLVAGGSTLGR